MKRQGSCLGNSYAPQCGGSSGSTTFLSFSHECLFTYSHTATTFDEKERCLSSVIAVLQNDPLLRTCAANMRAHILRAAVRLDYGMLEEALNDVAQALAVPAAPTALEGRAWRTKADCCRALGNINEAEEALRQWAACDPACRSKAMKEIEQLRQQQSTSS